MGLCHRPGSSSRDPGLQENTEDRRRRRARGGRHETPTGRHKAPRADCSLQEQLRERPAQRTGKPETGTASPWATATSYGPTSSLQDPSSQPACTEHPVTVQRLWRRWQAGPGQAPHLQLMRPPVQAGRCQSQTFTFTHRSPHCLAAVMTPMQVPMEASAHGLNKVPALTT